MKSSGGIAAVLGGAAAIGALAAWRVATASGSTKATITLQKIGRTGKRRHTPIPAATGASPRRESSGSWYHKLGHGCHCLVGLLDC